MKKCGVTNLEEIKESFDFFGTHKLYLTGKTYSSVEAMDADYRRSFRRMKTGEVVRLLQHVRNRVCRIRVGIDGTVREEGTEDTIKALDYMIGNVGRLKFVKVTDGSYLTNRIWIHNGFLDKSKCECDFDVARIQPNGKPTSKYSGHFKSPLAAAKYLSKNFEYICIQNSFDDYYCGFDYDDDDEDRDTYMH